MPNTPPVLTDLAASVTFLKSLTGVTPQIIDSSVTFTDPDNNFDNGTLVVTALLAEDSVAIHDAGTGTGHIGFSGGNVFFSGVLIGTATGGNGTDLTVTFNASATSPAIDALIQDLTYADSSSTPTATRTLTVTVTDDAGAPTHEAVIVNISAHIDGTKGIDIIDATHTVAGQVLPSDLADTITGGHGDDQISGLGGNDILSGGKGHDILHGGDGSDTLEVAGNFDIMDVLDGGAGFDTLEVVGKKPVSLAGFDATASSIEQLVGNDHVIIGTNASETFDFSGLTLISHVAGVRGGGGNDTLIGSLSADNLLGGAGNDILNGGQSNDVLSGGAGNDTFVTADGGGADTVTDYSFGHDKFDLTGVTGVHAFGDLHLTQVDPTTVLVDFDGVAGGDSLTIQRTTIAVLTAHQGDFLFS